MKGMTKRIMLVVMVAGLSSSNCLASPWLHLGSDGKSTHYFYKPKTFSVRDGGKIASAWTKKEYYVRPDAMTNKNADDIEGSKSMVVFQEFNCSERKIRTMVGQTAEGDSSTDLRSDWTPVSVGTIDDALLTVLCKEAAKLKTK